MNHIFGPNIVPLIQGVKPYLNTHLQTTADGVLSLINLLSSPPGQETVKAVSKLFSLPSKNTGITVYSVNGPVTLNINYAFVLFLILILLIFSGSFLLFGMDQIDKGSAL